MQETTIEVVTPSPSTITFARPLHWSDDVLIATRHSVGNNIPPNATHFGRGVRGVDEREFVIVHGDLYEVLDVEWGEDVKDPPCHVVVVYIQECMDEDGDLLPNLDAAHEAEKQILADLRAYVTATYPDREALS